MTTSVTKYARMRHRTTTAARTPSTGRRKLVPITSRFCEYWRLLRSTAGCGPSRRRTSSRGRGTRRARSTWPRSSAPSRCTGVHRCRTGPAPTSATIHHSDAPMVSTRDAAGGRQPLGERRCPRSFQTANGIQSAGAIPRTAARSRSRCPRAARRSRTAPGTSSRRREARGDEGDHPRQRHPRQRHDAVLRRVLQQVRAEHVDDRRDDDARRRAGRACAAGTGRRAPARNSSEPSQSRCAIQTGHRRAGRRSRRTDPSGRGNRCSGA